MADSGSSRCYGPARLATGAGVEVKSEGMCEASQEQADACVAEEGEAAATSAPAGPVVDDACCPRVLAPCEPKTSPAETVEAGKAGEEVGEEEVAGKGVQPDGVRQMQDLLMAMMQRAASPSNTSAR